jgi:hypothetical protein
MNTEIVVAIIVAVSSIIGGTGGAAFLSYVKDRRRAPTLQAKDEASIAATNSATALALLGPANRKIEELNGRVDEQDGLISDLVQFVKDLIKSHREHGIPVPAMPDRVRNAYEG